jgi:hypothetical protein
MTTDYEIPNASEKLLALCKGLELQHIGTIIKNAGTYDFHQLGVKIINGIDQLNDQNKRLADRKSWIVIYLLAAEIAILLSWFIVWIIHN